MSPALPQMICTALILCTPTLGWAHCRDVAQLTGYSTEQIPPEGAQCDLYLTETAQTGTSCRWGFDFRAPEATTFAATLWQQLTDCRPRQRLGDDLLVNHPDSYDLREWATEVGNFALSVKDKGALEQSFVFLRFAPSSEAN